MMKQKPLILCLLFASISLLLPLQAHSSDAEPVWIGTITMDYTLSNSINKDDSDKDGESRRSMNENAVVRVEIKACGKNAQNLRIKKPSVDYTQRESTYRKAKDGKVPGCVMEETFEASMNGALNQEFPDYISQQALSVDPASKSYMFSVSIGEKPLILITGNSNDVKKHPLNELKNIGHPGEEKEYSCELITYTNDITYDLLAVESSGSCDDSGRSCRATVPAIERAIPLMASYKGAYDGGKKIKGEVFYPDLKSIYGSSLQSLYDVQDKLFDAMKELGKYSPELQREMEKAKAELEKQRAESDEKEEGKKNPDLKTSETLRVSWEFEVLDECEDIIEELKQGLSVLRAYADDDVLERAADEGYDGTHDGDGRAYDDMVGVESLRQYRSHWWDPNYSPPDESDSGSGEESAEITMSTNNDCEIENYDEVKEDYERKCFPPVIAKAIYEHELKHVSQCKDEATGPDYKSGTPESYRKYELEAHCLSVGVVLDYARKNCKDCDLKPYEKEYKRLCGGK